jgi:hypothetical protein
MVGKKRERSANNNNMDNNNDKELPWYERVRKDQEEREGKTEVEKPEVSPTSILYGEADKEKRHYVLLKSRSLKQVLLPLVSSTFPMTQGFRAWAKVNVSSKKRTERRDVYDENVDKYTRFTWALTCHCYITHKRGKGTCDISMDYDMDLYEKQGKDYDRDFLLRFTKVLQDRKPWLVKEMGIR